MTIFKKHQLRYLFYYYLFKAKLSLFILLGSLTSKPASFNTYNNQSNPTLPCCEPEENPQISINIDYPLIHSILQNFPQDFIQELHLLDENYISNILNN